MFYVIQQPHSLTNPTDNYRVVAYEDFVALTKGEKQAIVPVAEFRHYEDAEARRDELNDVTAKMAAVARGELEMTVYTSREQAYADLGIPQP